MLYIVMKLTLKIKLLPSKEQKMLLLGTLKEANTACNSISKIAFTQKLFNQYRLHREVYHSHKASFNLSAQMVVRCISKVTDSYKMDRKKLRKFREYGSIAYDSRILTYRPNNEVSIWTTGGRQKMNYVCHNEKYIPYIKGESDLVYKKGKFFLFQTVDVPEEDVKDVEQFIGYDFGITDILVSSDGTKISADWVNQYREKRQKIRSSIQSKGTRGAKKLLKRLRGRERTTSSIINHTIAKQIVQGAVVQNKGIAIEDLKNIRKTSKRRNKKFRTKLGRWSFYDLRKKIEYKAHLKGIPVIAVRPNYTSQTCNVCKHIGKRTNKVFKCTNQNCVVDVLDADFNAAKNIATLGVVVNQPEKSNMYSCYIHYLDLKPIRSLVGG